MNSSETNVELSRTGAKSSSTQTQSVPLNCINCPTEQLAGTSLVSPHIQAEAAAEKVTI